MIHPQEEKPKTISHLTENNSSDAIPSFLMKTYQILQNNKYSDIISWTRNGEGFIVKKVKELSETVLPIYFRHSNYTSFVRQLNMYDFHKTRQQNHQNAFKNMMFKRGCKHLLQGIQRKDYKKTKESMKQLVINDKNILQLQKQMPHKQIKFDPYFQVDIPSLTNIIQINNLIQKKALFLAEVRAVPSQQAELLKLIDVLYDTNKLQKNMQQKLQAMYNFTKENQLSIQKCLCHSEDKHLCPTADNKVNNLQPIKEDGIGSYTTCLFSSFRKTQN